METSGIGFAPLVPGALVWIAAGLAGLAAGLAAWRGLKGWLWRGLAGLALAAALANPALVREERDPLTDIAVLVVDDSASMQVGDRAAEAEAAAQALRAFAENDPTLELVEVAGGRGPDGTRLSQTLAEALAQAPADRLAGVIIVSDGRLHDDPSRFARDLGAPAHHFMAGDPDAGDRRLIVGSAPRYGLVDDEVSFSLRIEDDAAADGSATVRVSVDGGEPITARAPIGEDVTVRTRLNQRGPNVVQIWVEEGPEELSLINNRAAVSVTGVRDRLRVLLVTGEPHNGARAWRNLLKSDPSVDLVHFTILRPLEKQDGTPAEELALIAFPVFELFQERLEEFDLIIFDRYRRRGILRPLYLDNIARYVENGGALLVTTGPPFAGPASLARSSLAAVLPARPTGEIAEGAFVPQVSDAGGRHPVTAPLAGREAEWGPWYRRIDGEPLDGEVLLETADGAPLLSLARAGRGRAAVLLSDQAWLWARGHEGGGPHDELFRRTAHWLMGEPELDEERLSARVSDGRLTAERTTLADAAPPLEVVWPSGRTEEVAMTPDGPGRFRADLDARDETGLVTLRSGEISAVTAAGALNPREFQDLSPDPDGLEALVTPTGGGVYGLHANGPPDLRRTRANADAAGRAWAGLRRNEAYVVVDSERTPLAPALLAVALILGLVGAAWKREGD